MLRRWAIAASLIVVIGGGVLLGVVQLGGVTRRPEGAGERFLQALSRRDQKAIDKFGSQSVVNSGFNMSKLPKDFYRIEVGRAGHYGAATGVPFRVQPTSKGDFVQGVLLVEPTGNASPRDWKVVGSAPVTAALSRVPSEGGSPPAGAPRQAWVLALVTVLALALGCEFLLRGLRDASAATSSRTKQN